MIEERSPDLGSQPSKVAVIGLGYVGLPLALLFVNKGFEVYGIDVDERKIRSLEARRSYLPDLSDEDIQKVMDGGRFHPGTAFEKAGEAKAVIVCVPTPLTPYHTPDLSFLQDAAKAVGEQLQQGQTVILESSTYPGTTREVLKPILEKTSGLRAGKDFGLGYSPERIDPGNKKYTVEQIPKLVSGLTKRCGDAVEELYGQVFQRVVRVTSTEIAEMAKIVENSQRLVNITFANELALICDQMNIDVWEVIDAAATKPFGFTAYYPGPGIGGHCIPVDPLYLQWKSRAYGTDSKFIELSESMNRSIPQVVAERVLQLVADAERSRGAAGRGVSGAARGEFAEDVESPLSEDVGEDESGRTNGEFAGDEAGRSNQDVEEDEAGRTHGEVAGDVENRSIQDVEEDEAGRTNGEVAGDVENRSNQDVEEDEAVRTHGDRAPSARRRPHILLYGVAYKKDVNDVRESPALELIPILRSKGAQVEYYDPYIDEIRVERETLKSVELTDEMLEETDCVIILTDHTGIPVERIIKHAPLVFDTRNATAVWKDATHVHRFGAGKRAAHRKGNAR